MPKHELIDQLLYLDKDYISSIYEANTGTSSETKITRAESVTAGVRIPLFSGGASSHESRSYSVSTTLMLHGLMSKLEQIPSFSGTDIAVGKKSATRWVDGSLSLFEVILKTKTHTTTLIGKPKEAENQSEEKVVGKETYFGIHSNTGDKFALITSSECFVSGLDALAKLNGTVVAQVSIPVRALLRIYAARSSFSEWIAVPLVVIENETS